MTPEPYPTPWRWVDLGLPSGTLWLDRNVGASSSEDIGEYFMWGEVIGRKTPPDYDMAAYYETLGLNRIAADLTVENDAASYYYGNKFRMPSVNEWRELIDNTTSVEEESCYRLISIVNGNSILIPKSGYMTQNQIINGTIAREWTNTFYDGQRAYDIRSESGSITATHIETRTRALPVRPVYNR